MVGVGVTLVVMVGLSAWTSLEMWSATNVLEGLRIIDLMLELPPAATAGAALDIGGRALARRLRAARGHR